MTATEFAEAFHSFYVGRMIGEELSSPFDKGKNHPAALLMQKYGAKMNDLLNACFSREYLLMKRNSFVYIFRLIRVNPLFIYGLIDLISTFPILSICCYLYLAVVSSA